MNAPVFNLEDARSGKIVSLNDFKDQPVLLTFWVSWCPDCHRDIPKKSQLFESMKNTELAFLTINVTGREHEADDGITFMNDNQLPFPVLRDNGRDVYDAYKCEGVPTTFILDRSHTIRYQFDDKTDMLDIMKALGTVITANSPMR